MVYIGVDLHRKRSQLAALDAAGEPIFNRSIPSQADEFLRVFGELGPEPIEVAFEATIGWGWFADLLADAGRTAHMAHPLATRAIATARVKNDAVDARTLAHLLRTHLLPEAWIAPLEVREARRLVRMRAGLVRIRSRLKCQIHALLAEAGVSVSMTDLFGRGGRDLLADLNLPAISQGRLEANLRLIDTLTGEVDLAERDIARRFRGDPRMARLLPIPGIGPLGAATIIARGLGHRPLRDPRAPDQLGRPDADRAFERRSHAPRPHQQAGLALAALDLCRGCHERRPRPGARPVCCPDRPSPRREDRPGRAGATTAHPQLLRPARSAGLCRLSGCSARSVDTHGLS